VVEPAPRPPSDDARVDTRPSSACGSAKIRAGCWWAAWLRQRRSGPAYGFRSRGGLASKDVAVLGPLSFVCDFNYACLPVTHGLKNGLKTGEIGLDWFYQFLINWSVNLFFFNDFFETFLRSGPALSIFDKPTNKSEFLNFFDFFQKWFTGFGTGLPVIPTGKPV
jgi:hypothetical protein